MTTDRSSQAIVGEIRGLLDDDPMWVDFEGRDDHLVGFLLGEGRARHVPRELLWEYAATRWQELYGPDDEDTAAD